MVSSTFFRSFAQRYALLGYRPDIARQAKNQVELFWPQG
jgi:hypothetical protein